MKTRAAVLMRQPGEWEVVEADLDGPRDPQVAQRFYREHFAAAMDRLAAAWREVEDRYGFPFESPDGGR